MPLLFLFIVVPVIEIYLLIEVGSQIGAITTIALTVFTAVLGAQLVRIQGFAAIQRLQVTMAQGGAPGIEVFEGAFLLVAGAFLVTPGFFTDFFGFLFLIPAVRRSLIRSFLARSNIVPPRQNQPKPSSELGGNTLEGEFRREDD